MALTVRDAIPGLHGSACARTRSRPRRIRRMTSVAVWFRRRSAGAVRRRRSAPTSRILRPQEATVTFSLQYEARFPPRSRLWARYRRIPFCADTTSRCSERPEMYRRIPFCVATTSRCDRRPDRALVPMGFGNRRSPLLRLPSHRPASRSRLHGRSRLQLRNQRPSGRPLPARAVGSWAGSGGCSAAESTFGVSGQDRPDISRRVDLHTRAKFPKVVSCVKVRDCDGHDVPGRLAPGRGAKHAVSVRGGSLASLRGVVTPLFHGGLIGRVPAS